jgi:hypothetical protein
MGAVRTWLELETRFRALADPLGDVRLDVQWGDAGERAELVGGFAPTKLSELRTLCGIGGRLLEHALERDSSLGEDLLAVQSPTDRWLRLIAKYSGDLREDGPPGFLTDPQTGETTGLIHVGAVAHFVESAANQCLRLHVDMPVRDERGWRERIYDDYGKELVVGAILAVIAAILGAFFGV